MNSPLPATLVGLEIAGADLRVAVMRTFLHRARLVTAFVLEDFCSLDEPARRDAIAGMVERHDLSGSRSFLVLPQDAGLVRQMDFPVEVEESLRAAVELQIESLSPWPPDEIVWEMSAASKPVKGKRKVAVAVVPKHTVDSWSRLFAMAGLDLTGISLSQLSWAHAARRIWPDRKPTLVIGVEPSYAEAVLLAGDGTIVSAHEAGVQRSAEEVGRIAGRLMSLGRIESPDELRLVTYGAAAEGLDGDNPPLALDGAPLELRRYFGAVAAAMTGLGSGGPAVNVLPPDERFRHHRMQLVPTYALAGLLVVLAVLLALRGPYQWSVYASRLDSAIAAVAPEVRDVTDQEAELTRLTERYRLLAGHLAGRDRTLETLAELVRVLPADTWLGGFTMEGNTVTMNGFSASASDLLRRVEESPLFEGAEFASSVARDESGRDRFTLRLTIESANAGSSQ